MTGFEQVSVIIGVVTALINLAGLAFVGTQLREARLAARRADRVQQDQLERLRRQVTLEATSTTFSYQETMKAKLPWNDRDRHEVEAFLEEAEGDREKLAAVREYLNYLEYLAVGVKRGVFDLDTIGALSGGRIVATVAAYRPHILRIREELNSSDVYEDIEWLATGIQALRST